MFTFLIYNLVCLSILSMKNAQLVDSLVVDYYKTNNISIQGKVCNVDFARDTEPDIDIYM